MEIASFVRTVEVQYKEKNAVRQCAGRLKNTGRAIGVPITKFDGKVPENRTFLRFWDKNTHKIVKIVTNT